VVFDVYMTYSTVGAVRFLTVREVNGDVQKAVVRRDHVDFFRGYTGFFFADGPPLITISVGTSNPEMLLIRELFVQTSKAILSFLSGLMPLPPSEIGQVIARHVDNGSLLSIALQHRLLRVLPMLSIASVFWRRAVALTLIVLVLGLLAMAFLMLPLLFLDGVDALLEVSVS